MHEKIPRMLPLLAAFVAGVAVGVGCMVRGYQQADAQEPAGIAPVITASKGVAVAPALALAQEEPPAEPSTCEEEIDAMIAELQGQLDALAASVAEKEAQIAKLEELRALVASQ